jgi:serine phosphatase
MGVINKKSVFYSIYILLAARASVAGIAPFGTAAFAVALMAYDMSSGVINIILYAAACLIGTLLTGVWQQAVIASLTILLFTISLYFLKTYDRDEIPFVLKCAAALVFAGVIPSVIVLAATECTLMDIVNLVLQAAASFIMFFVYRIGEQSASDFTENNSTSYKMNQEELACAAIMAIIALMGLPALNIFGLSVRNVISICIIMIFSLRGGIGTGAAAGIMIGIITNYSSAITICLYAFCGFLSGLLNKLGKVGVVSAFVVGNVILTAMLGGTKEIIYGMYETGFSAIIFLILPQKLLNIVKIPFLEENMTRRKADKPGDAVPVRLDYAGKVRNAAIRKASFYADTLTEMSSEFIDISTAATETSKEDPCVIRVFNKVCANCQMSGSCWKREYRLREKALRECKRRIEKEGDKNPGVMALLGKFCIKPQEVIDEIRIAIEIQRTEKICNTKIAECRNLIVKQLGEMGKMSSHIADEIKYATNYDFDCEKRIINALKRNEIYIYDAVVVKNQYDMLDVTLYTHKNYDKEKMNEILRIISKETGQRMQLYSAHTGNKKNSMRELHFVVRPQVKIHAEALCMPAAGNQLSGDSYCFMDLPDGRTFLVLSDGMGTGRRASEQSNAVVRLMELYVKSGIDISSAVSMVNMMLTSGAADVMTASIDICSVNRHEKRALFVKMGAMPSVIVGPERSRVIEINQPPAGVTSELNDLYCKMTECEVASGECIVLYTDGVYDAFKMGGVNQKVFYEYLASVVRKYDGDEKRCHKIAEEVLKKASGFVEDTEGDDMSVAVIEIL